MQPLNRHLKNPLIRTADLDALLGGIHANPLRPRRIPFLIRTQENLSIFGDRTRHPLQSQCEPVEIGRAVGELDVVFSVVAAGVLFWQAAVCPVVRVLVFFCRSWLMWRGERGLSGTDAPKQVAVCWRVV